MFKIATRLTLANQEVQDVVKEQNEELIINLVKKLEEVGADAIYISGGPYPSGIKAGLMFLINCVQKATKLPICVETIDFEAIETIIDSKIENPIIFRGIEAVKSDMSIVLPLLIKSGFSVVFKTKSDDGVPIESDARLELAMKLIEEAVKGGIEPDKIYVDPIIMPLASKWGQEYAKESLIFMDKLKEVADPPPKIIASIEDFAFELPEDFKIPITRHYFTLLLEHGLDSAIFDILNKDLREVIKFQEILKAIKPLS